MGLSRDRRAHTGLNDTQQKEVFNDPYLATLRQERETCKQQLKYQGFYLLLKVKGNKLYGDIYNKYDRAKKEITKQYQHLHWLRLRQVIREFHDSIDTIEISKQLSGRPAVDVLTLPPVEFELRERATIAGMLFKPFRNDKGSYKVCSRLGSTLTATRNASAQRLQSATL